MNVSEFRDMIAADPELRVTRFEERATFESSVIEIQFVPLGGGHELPISEIIRCSREDLLPLLRFEREGRIMRHINGAGRAGGRPAMIRSAVPRLSSVVAA